MPLKQSLALIYRLRLGVLRIRELKPSTITEFKVKKRACVFLTDCKGEASVHLCTYCGKKHFSSNDLLNYCRHAHPKLYDVYKNTCKMEGKLSHTVPLKQRIKVVLTKAKGQRKVTDHVCIYCRKAHPTYLDLYKHYMKEHHQQYALNKLGQDKSVKIMPNEIKPEDTQSNLNSAMSRKSLCGKSYILAWLKRQGTTNPCLATAWLKRHGTTNPCLATEHTFKNNKELLEHYARYHPECQPKFRCEFCQCVYPTLSELSQHRQSTHRIPKEKQVSNQPSPPATLLAINEASESRFDGDQIPSSMTPMPLCIVDCPVQGQDEIQATSDVIDSNIIEIQPIPGYSEGLVDACYKGNPSQEMMVDNLLPSENTNDDSNKCADETKENVKFEKPSLEIKEGNMTSHEKVIKEENKDTTIQKDKVVSQTILTKAEISDAMKAENLRQEYSEACKLKEDNSVNNAMSEVDRNSCPDLEITEIPIAVNKKINIPIDTQSSQDKLERIGASDLHSRLSSNTEVEKGESVNSSRPSDINTCRNMPMNNTVVPLPACSKQLFPVYMKERVPLSTNRNPNKRKHSTEPHGLSGDNVIRHAPQTVPMSTNRNRNKRKHSPEPPGLSADNAITHAPQTVIDRKPCYFCSLTDSKLSEFINHYCLAHGDNPQTNCPHKYCVGVFATYTKLKQHYGSQHCAEELCGVQEVLKGLYGLSCAYCPERYKNHATRDAHYLKNHYMMLDTKDFTGTALGKHLFMDETGFWDLSIVNRHMNMYHGGAPAFRCPTCGMYFPMPRALWKHQKMSHKGTGTEVEVDKQSDAFSLGSTSSDYFVECDKCNKVFCSQKYLEKHVRLKH